MECEEGSSKILYKGSLWDVNWILNRNKVDLTKYIEEHNFNFDNVFDY
jgi:hypothetical protein